MEVRIGNIEVKFELNPPVSETGYISENFNCVQKCAYATSDASELIPPSHQEAVIRKIFQILYERAKIQDLDYLQKLSVNGTQCWCIDNGDYLTLMLPENY